jgi:dihydroorotate dehydrogenase
MYRLIRFFLFTLSPEKAHDVALKLIQFGISAPFFGKYLRKSFLPESSKPIEFAGIMFPNIVGLAAGFDKDAKYLNLWKTLGFGHVEVGTVTPVAQPGNPKPRLFRIPQDFAVVNRMGFNNQGVDAMIARLKKRPQGLIVGGNIGKNKDTQNENAETDYIICFEKLYDYVDYITVNVSSPNTPGLRDLQSESFLVPLFEKLHAIRKSKSIQKPIFIKIAPDFQVADLKKLVTVIKRLNVQAVIATNTTISRENLSISPKEIESIGAGGLSGAPLFESSNIILSNLSLELGPEIPLIGVGGIFNGRDASEKLIRGAGLVQVYTGFIYEGPWIVKHILSEVSYN